MATQKHLLLSVMLVMIVTARISAMKAQSCREAWRPNCKARYSLTCYDRFTYCDCQCDLSPNLKPAAGRLPKRW
ncbi:uncharacterized protein LOC142579683 isoform X2 [Dermacentor variabilis]|uniref:uncharacterized protein LOC142579683 isoform X2 n=1 Tax=Dermacentor variabilis TaxID=34621 RepID=UPI003F5C2DC1